MNKCAGGGCEFGKGCGSHRIPVGSEASLDMLVFFFSYLGSLQLKCKHLRYWQSERGSTWLSKFSKLISILLCSFSFL